MAERKANPPIPPTSKGRTVSMRQTFIDIVNLIIAILAAICGWLFIDLSIGQADGLWTISIVTGLMALCLAYSHGGPLVYRSWRWLRQADKIKELDERVVELIEDGANWYEKAAEMSAELKNEVSNYEYNMKRLKDELSIANDKYEILYRTLIYNVTNPANAGFDIMAKEAGGQSNLAKLVVDEHIHRNMSFDNLSKIKAESFEKFLAKINNKK